jgi:MFS family permease
VFNLGGGLIAPTLPLYARHLGADYRDLGLIGASHGLAFAALTIPLGRASDRFGRRTLLLAATLAVGAAAVSYLLATDVAGLALGKLLEAAGWAAFWPALEARVAERFGARAGAAMGVGYAAYAAAFVIGTSAAGFVIEAAGLRAPFGLYLLTSALTLLLILLLGGKPVAEHEGWRTHGSAETAALDPARARRQRVLAYGTGFVYVFGLGVILAFLPAYAADRGLPARAVGLLLGAYWVARFVGSLGIGAATAVVGRRAVLCGALLAGAAGAGLIALPAAGTAALALGVVIVGLSAGACAPTCVGLIADHVRETDRGMAMGLFEAACGTSILIGGLAGGFAAESLGAAAPYLMFAGLAVAWTLVLSRRLSTPAS